MIDQIGYISALKYNHTFRLQTSRFDV